MIMTCLARFATDDDHLQKGTSLSVPLKLMPRCAYRDLRCFFSDIDHDAFRVCLSGLSASSGFSVVCLAVGIRRHWYFHCLGRFLLWYVILGIRCFFLVCSRRAHGTGMVGRFGCTFQGEMLPVLRLSLGNVFACASGVLRQLRAVFVYAVFEL